MSDSCDKLGTSSDYKADSGISSGFISTETCVTESDGLIVVTEEFDDEKVVVTEELADEKVVVTEEIGDEKVEVPEEIDYLKTVKALLKVGEYKPKNVSKNETWKKYYTQFPDGDTILHESIIFGYNPYIVRQIIQLAPDPSYLDIQNQKAEAPIHLAMEFGQYEIVRDLLVAGCKPGIRDIFGNSALHLACKIGNLNGVKTILEPIEESETKSMNLKYEIKTYPRMDLEQWNYVGQTCVHIAAIYNRIDILRYLCQFGANINAREGLMGYAPLHFAYDFQNHKLIDFLTKECPNVDHNVKTYRGLTARELHCYVSEDDDDEEDSEGESVEDIEDAVDRLCISL